MNVPIINNAPNVILNKIESLTNSKTLVNVWKAIKRIKKPNLVKNVTNIKANASYSVPNTPYKMKNYRFAKNCNIYLNLKPICFGWVPW